MVEKVHGDAFPAQALTGSMNYFTVRTTLDIRPVSGGNTPPTVEQKEAQNRLNKLVEIISTRAQPIILGDIVVTTEASPVNDLPVTASESGSIPVFNLKFAIEHNVAWAPEALADSLNGIAGFVHTAPTTGNNVSVAIHTQLV